MVMAAPTAGATVWTADCSATVELERCQGPRAGQVAPPACCRETCTDCSAEPFDLSDPATKVTLYECILGGGTPFDIYRWVNLPDLALLWPRLRLADGVRAEWGGALAALGLLDGAGTAPR